MVEPEASKSTVSVSLPEQLAVNDATLHVVAARFFGLPQVRSLTVSRPRGVAIVRLTSTTASSDRDAIAGELAEIISSVSLLGADGVAGGAPPPELLSWSDSRDDSISFMRMPVRVHGWRKIAYLMLAGAALSLGLLGILLPGLPTTPFVLLGSYFLVRSSTRLHQRLMASRLFGGVLRDWHIHRGLRPHVRARAIAVVAVVVIVSLVVARPPWVVALVIGLLVACGLTVIWRLPSVDETEFGE